jgi:2-oxoglutarate dehydrogenase complex dehydrogenase (E1) component-like enzyme
LIIILFILSKRNKAHLLVKKDAKENTQDKSDYEIKIKSAKEFVDKYRKAGYRDAVTRQLFLEKGWNQKDLDRIF